MIVIGIETKQGTFNNAQGNQVAYKTNYIHLVGDSKNTVGQRTESYKIGKRCELVGASTLDELIGHEVLISTQRTDYGISATAIIVRE